MERLRKNAQFSDVYRAHHSFANGFIVMYVRNNGESINRVGVSVSKKVGNSVVRHRVKRLMKEAFRTSEDMFNSGLDIVFVAKKSAAEMTFDDAKKSLMDLAASHHILSKTGN